ncbi:MAG: carbamoyltransferase HypF [Halodesulfurarchaeum sp.]
MATDRRVELHVEGVVQGVGFRPFVYRTATRYDLAGHVKNLGDAGVEIVLEGDQADIAAFRSALDTEAPPLARIDAITATDQEPRDATGFAIVDSDDASGGTGTIPPDTGMCAACRADMRDPDSRYHNYWATACVDCGPRFTVINDLPYDRPRTAMAAFPMCEACREEYEDPSDRRYHAQTIACPDCGPTLTLTDTTGTTLATREAAIAATTDRIAGGDIVAIKGIGGAHLACDATDPDVVATLRDRTGRPAKPFAVMAPTVEAIEAFATVAPEERETLTDVRRPITLLDQRDGVEWVDAVAPGLHTIGVMLPYAGLHHRLFDALETPLVMTSANHPGSPMCTTGEAIRTDLEDVIEAALVHDRDIVARCDDSVVRHTGGDRRFIRRSRGWVPTSLPRPTDGDPRDVLAVGPAYDVTVALGHGEDVYLSQYIGDVDDPDTLAFHRQAREHLADLTGTTPSVVACDLHPDFETTAAAERLAEAGLEGPVRVQHHHAHAAGLLAEHGRDRAVVITADGTGYGPEGTIWGGEVLDATRTDYERVGGLSQFRLPGGEAAIEYPGRILAALLEDRDRIDAILVDRGGLPDHAAAGRVRRQVATEINAPATTSAGRFLDAISALLDAGTHRHYEGEPAMRLEALAAHGNPLDITVPSTDRGDTQTVDVPALTRALADLTADHERADVAATAQHALATGLADIAIEAAHDRGREAIGFSGGVAYNDAITQTIEDRVTAADLTFLGHDRVPPGDGGIAYGQAIVATHR